MGSILITMVTIVSFFMASCTPFLIADVAGPLVLPEVNSTSVAKQLASKLKPAIKPTMFRGNIVIEGDDKDDIPEFRIYFNGMETFSNNEGFFNFPADEDLLDEYSFIVTKNVNYHVEKNNTLKELVIKNSHDYRQFSLRRTGTSNAAWSWEEQTLRTNNFVVPHKSILFFVNPKCLLRLDAWKIDLGDKFIPIPKIVLKGEYRKWMERQADKSLLYSLDLKPFHERIRERHKVTPNGLGKMELTDRG